jgi:large subunit ribosomal protein L10
MKKEQKEQVVDELTERLKAADTLLVADYRGLTMPQIDDLRTRLLSSGARFTVVKNTLTRRAAEAAGADALLALLDGPSAIAFLEADGDMVAAAKALADSARETQVLEIRGGILQGRAMTAAEVETLAKLPPEDVLRGQVLGAIVAPLTALAGLLNAPLQNLVGLIDARIEQLGGEQQVAPEPEAETEESADGDSEVLDEPGRASAASPPTLAAEKPAEEEPAVEESPAEETPQADATASAAETPEEES